jgi:trans-aconitate methyltransferase
VDHLVARGFGCVTVLDVSASALERAKQRLPADAPVTWIEADVTSDWTSRTRPVDVWHDRAVFHFLTDARDRESYLHRMRAALTPGGCVILATFAPDGPERCSGLPVMRYSTDDLARQLGGDFQPVESCNELHRTPAGRTQPFCYSRFVRRQQGSRAGRVRVGSGPP